MMRAPYSVSELSRRFMLAAAQADGGCSSCATQVLESAMTLLPSLPWRSVWEDEPVDEWGDRGGDFHYFNSIFEDKT